MSWDQAVMEKRSYLFCNGFSLCFDAQFGNYNYGLWFNAAFMQYSDNEPLLKPFILILNSMYCSLLKLLNNLHTFLSWTMFKFGENLSFSIIHHDGAMLPAGNKPQKLPQRKCITFLYFVYFHTSQKTTLQIVFRGFSPELASVRTIEG